MLQRVRRLTAKMKSYKECEVRLFSKVSGHRYEFTIAEVEDIFRYVHIMDATKEPLVIKNRDHSDLSLLLSGNMNGIHFKISADGEPIISQVFSARELRYLLKEVEYLVKHEKVNF